MARVESARNEIADQQVAETDVAPRASFTHEVLGRSILDEGQHLEIAVEVPGWTDTVAVHSPARPGAVRGAVEKVLRDLGLTRL